jgi:hypothetical protein
MVFVCNYARQEPGSHLPGGRIFPHQSSVISNLIWSDNAHLIWQNKGRTALLSRKYFVLTRFPTKKAFFSKSTFQCLLFSLNLRFFLPLKLFLFPIFFQAVGVLSAKTQTTSLSVTYSASRVTRFGEFSPIGWLFTLGSFFNYRSSPNTIYLCKFV